MNIKTWESQIANEMEIRYATSCGLISRIPVVNYTKMGNAADKKAGLLVRYWRRRKGRVMHNTDNGLNLWYNCYICAVGSTERYPVVFRIESGNTGEVACMYDAHIARDLDGQEYVVVNERISAFEIKAGESLLDAANRYNKTAVDKINVICC